MKMICPKCNWIGEETESLYLPFDHENIDCCPICSDREEPYTWVVLDIYTTRKEYTMKLHQLFCKHIWKKISEEYLRTSAREWNDGTMIYTQDVYAQQFTCIKCGKINFIEAGGKRNYLGK